MGEYMEIVKKIQRPQFLSQTNYAKKRIFRDIC